VISLKQTIVFQKAGRN